MKTVQPHKFPAHNKCECYSQRKCNCPRKSASTIYFLANIHDIADTLVEVMIICGIHQCKAKAAVDVITHAFLHYDEIRHRVDAVPRKRLCKEDLIHDLGRKCLMNRMEAQLTYSIIKRAFKAFYHGSGEGTIRNRFLESETLHSQECLWVHAAKRTAQIFASYEGMFFSAQRSYEIQIRCAYRKLYDRLHSRKFPLNEPQECVCKGCTKRRGLSDLDDVKNSLFLDDSLLLVGKAMSHEQKLMDLEQEIRLEQVEKGKLRILHDAIETIVPPPKECDVLCAKDAVRLSKKEEAEAEAEAECHEPPVPVARRSSRISLHLPRCYKCNCPKLVCDCDVDRETGVLSAECSQGPYICRWVRADDDDVDVRRPDPCIRVPENHQCPVDCDATSQLTCVSDCECDCGEVCECECAIDEESSGYDDENDALNDEAFEGKIEEHDELESESETLTYVLGDMSERDPHPSYAGCRVFAKQHHVIEEAGIGENPASLAGVQEHMQRMSVRSEEQLKHSSPGHQEQPAGPAQKKPSKTKKAESATRDPETTNEVQKNKKKADSPRSETGNTKLTEEQRRQEAEDISKILGELI